MFQRDPVDLDVLRQVMLFRALEESELRQVRVLLKERRYRKGEIVFHQGDPGNCLFVIGAGRVRIYMTSPDGREATIRIYGRGASFGEFAVLDGGPRSTSAAALDDLTTQVLYRDDFLALLRGNFALVERVIAMLTERLRYTNSHLGQLAFLSAPGRVAALLVQLSGGEAEAQSQVRLELSQQELADFTNTTREWVNRALRDFAEHGLIRLERRAVIVLDRAGLLSRLE